MKNFKHTIHQYVWIFLIAFLGLGIIYPRIGAVALICMLAPVFVAFFKGRAWCGTYCPRGSFNDVILAKFSFKGKVPTLLRSTWFRLTFLVLLMSAFAIQLTLAWGDPVATGRVFLRMIIITTLITLILGFIYQPRTWCQICPMGTIAHYVTKWRSQTTRPSQITFNQAACVGCKICTKNCPINIEVHSYKKAGRVTHPDCLKCNQCVAKCPKKALSSQ
ncbi:MAG: 4Fe-4S binding protein [Bacillota bacterium]|jgi:ferredoxin-type protein NapH